MSRVLPIIFNGEMVRAILEGRKTVTRRIMKLQPWKIGEGEYECRHEKGFYDMGSNNWVCRQCGCGVVPMKRGSYFHAPYQPGDILYVRETWAEWTSGYIYRAWPYPFPQPGCFPETVWHPSIHMPKEAARIWLTVTGVRVERLKDIKPEGLREEGIKLYVLPEECECQYDKIGAVYFCRKAREEFSKVWDSTIRKADIDRYGWDANPWVWVIEFERCGKPEPCILRGIEPAEEKRPCIGYGDAWADEPCEMCKGCTSCSGNM